MFPRTKSEVSPITTESDAVQVIQRRRTASNIAAELFSRLTLEQQMSGFEHSASKAFGESFEEFIEWASKVQNPDLPILKESIESLIRHGDDAVWVALW